MPNNEGRDDGQVDASATRSRRHTAGLVVLAVALTLVACGGAQPRTAARPTGTTSTATGPTSAAAQPAASAAALAAQRAAREKALAAKVRRLIPIARQSQVGKSRREQLRIADAVAELGVVAGQSLHAVRPLVHALSNRDYKLIADLADFYVALGKPGSEPILAAAVGQLYPTGDPKYMRLPFVFLGAGNARLRRLVIKELENHGFKVTGQPGFPGASWGSSGAYKGK